MRISDWSSDVALPIYRRVDPIGGLVHVERMAQQHRRRQDRRARIGLALPGDLGRAAVDRVVQASSEERSVGKGGVSSGRCRVWSYHYTKKRKHNRTAQFE